MENDFASILRTLHDKSGLTVRAFAKKCGISPSSLQRYEKREIEPSQKVLRRISANLGHPISVLVGEERLVVISEKELDRLKSKKGA
jgi:transcriptional regulator with XRE-family HTH domain